MAAVPGSGQDAGWGAAGGAAGGARALRTLIGQCTRSGVGRRAALLHLDRLPAALAKPHYQRLAREAMMRLSSCDHAQGFDLPQGRLAIVWRSRGADEIGGAMAALQHLLTDLPDGQTVKLGQILSLFDLPVHAPWLLDSLAETDAPGPLVTAPGLDAALLTRLSDSLAQADIGPFLRSRPVMHIGGPEPRLAWEERIVSWAAVASCLCPDRNPDDGSWLARSLSLYLDRRVLSAMTGRDRVGERAFALEIGVASLLSPAFLAFDEALPAALRGRVVLRLDAADILADAATFCFARRFTQARSYTLLLRNAEDSLLDAAACGVDYVEYRLTEALQADPRGLPARDRLVLDEVDDAARLDWARAQGCVLAKGAELAVS
jgi:hypothetical protein